MVSFDSLNLATLAVVNSLAFLANAQLARVIEHCTHDKTVALTFDDGPYIYQNDIMDLADRYDAKVTFFVNGDNYGCIYDYAHSLQEAHRKGHQIGSHTWAHKDLSSLSYHEVNEQMMMLEDALQKIVGVQPAFMRPPYGSFNENVLKVSQDRGQSVVIWDFDSGDSVGQSAFQSKSDYNKCATSNPKNVLALNHETYEPTAHEVIPQAMANFQQKGYKMVTVAQCLGEEPYQWIQPPTPRDDSWHCS
ncbi:carbohydrate esterase family 4 protein [Flagelloscypha sp. PMI_526]|nr:carbohydrate esterase family 4 protein [Flagelloscypha sp. PMI_526]